MDASRFDALATALATSDTSRRSIFQRLFAGGLAAALAAIGIGGFTPEEAEAKNCKKKCKKKNTAKKRRKCRKKCDKPKPPACDVCDDGSCDFDSVQEAIDDAEDGDTIRICEGTYEENLTIDKDLTIIGAGEDVTALQGDDTASVVTLGSSVTVAIQDLTITGGGSDGVGGGIANGTAQTTLTGVHVTGNSAGTRGGGIDIDAGGSVTLSNCRVTENVAGTDGGGIFTVGELTFQDNNSVTGNEAAFLGGGIGIGIGGAVMINDTSSVTDNHAGLDAGGVLNQGTVTCAAETVTDNTAGDPEQPSNCIDDGGGTGCDSCSPSP